MAAVDALWVLIPTGQRAPGAGTGGPPIVPPARGGIAEMLGWPAPPRHAVLGEVEPLRGVATVEKVAANAVMAGCRPEHFPVVLAALGAILDPAFNLRG